MDNRGPDRGFGFLRLTAGLADAGFASLGTFLVGAYAARFLPVEDLGAFAVFQSALFLAAVLPFQGALLPAQAEALRLPRESRLVWLPSTIAAGLPLAITASTAILVATLLTAATISTSTTVALTVTAIAAVMVSPLQDHVRWMMHVAEVSRRAALISAVFCGTVLATLYVLDRLGAPRVWVPLSALVVGNIVSMAVGLALSRHNSASPAGIPTPPRFKDLWKSGRWLVVAGGISPLATFVTVLLVTWLAGAEAMGHAEAARVVAQPIFIFGVGLASIFTPRSMEAAQARSESRARHVWRRFALLNIAFTAPYIALFGWDIGPNPAVGIFSAAYAVPGLVALQVAGNLIWMLTRPFQAELVGAKAERRLTLATLIGNSTQPVSALSALQIGAVAKPLSDLISGVAASFAYRAVLRGLYRSKSL